MGAAREFRKRKRMVKGERCIKCGGRWLEVRKTQREDAFIYICIKGHNILKRDTDKDVPDAPDEV